MISEDQVVAEVLNKFLINIVPNLKNVANDSSNSNDQVFLNKFSNHPTIFMIKNKTKFDQCCFDQCRQVTWDDIKNNNLGNVKVTKIWYSN